MRAHVLLALTLLGLTATRVMAADAVLVGTPTVSPSPLVPGSAADVTVTLRADAKKATAPVLLEVLAGKAVVGKLADAPLGANQSKAYKIAIKVPADAVKKLDLRIMGWGAELGTASVAVKEAVKEALKEPVREPVKPAKEATPVKPPPPAPPPPATPPPAAARPAAPPPSLTQSVNTARATLTGNRGQQGTPPPPPSLTQSVNTSPASMTGNRGQQQVPPPPPSLTQTVNTPSATMTGNR